MGLHFTNVFTEYKSFQISNEYINTTISASENVVLDFVIVDNSLDDENYEKLSSYYTDTFEELSFEGLLIRKAELTFGEKKTAVLYVKNDKNNGYGPGGNLAMRVALKFLKPDYLVVSNNDMLCLDERIAFDKVDKVFKKHSDVGIVGVNVKNLDESKQTPCRYVGFVDRWILPELFFPLSRKFKKHHTSDLILNPPTDYVYRVRGSFMILRPEAFEKCGGFDEHIFLYGEEPILAERMKHCGFKVYHLNDIHMLHNHVMDNKTVTRNEGKKLKQRFKSEMYYYKEYRGVSDRWIWLAKLLFAQYLFRFELFQKVKDRAKK